MIKVRPAYLLIPVLLATGYAGFELEFMPNPRLRWLASSLTVFFIGALYLYRRRTRPPDAWETRIHNYGLLLASLLVVGASAYMTLQVTLPAWYTQTFGRQAQYEFVLTQRPVAPPGDSCLNRLRIARPAKDLPDSICIRKADARDLKNGDHVLFRGTQSTLGFRFSLRRDRVQTTQLTE